MAEMTLEMYIQECLSELASHCERRGGSTSVDTHNGVFRATFNPKPMSEAPSVYSEWSDSGCFVSVGDDGRFELEDENPGRSVLVAKTICQAVICNGYRRRIWLKSEKPVAIEIDIETDTGRWSSGNISFLKRITRHVDQDVSAF